MAAWLADHGHEVRVVAAPPYYPAWKTDSKVLVAAIQARAMARRRRLASAPLGAEGAWGGHPDSALAVVAIMSFPVMVWQTFWRPDLVLTVAPAFVCAPAALLTARLAHAKSWLHLQDFEIDVAFGLGLLKGEFLQRIVLRMERLDLQRFDTVSTISGRMIERLLRKGVAPERTRYFPNWVNISRTRHGAVRGGYRAELGIPRDAVVALFSGTLGGNKD